MSRLTQASSVTDQDKKPREKDLLLILSHLLHAAEHSLSSSQATQFAQNTVGKTLSTTVLFAKQANRTLFFGAWGVIFFLIKSLDFLLRGCSGEKLKDIFTPEKTRLFISFLFEALGGALLSSQKNKNANDRDYAAVAFAIGLFLFGGFIGANGDPRKIKDAAMGVLTPTLPHSNATQVGRSESINHNKKISREETIAQFFACRRGLITSGTSTFSTGLNQNTLAISDVLLYSAVFDILCGSIVMTYSAGCVLVDCCSQKARQAGGWQIVERNILAGKKPQFLLAALLMLASGIITLCRRYEDTHNDAWLDFAGLCTYLAGAMTVLATTSFQQLAAMMQELPITASMVGTPSFVITRPSGEMTAPYGEEDQENPVDAANRTLRPFMVSSDEARSNPSEVADDHHPSIIRISSPHARLPQTTHVAQTDTMSLRS